MVKPPFKLWRDMTPEEKKALSKRLEQFRIVKQPKRYDKIKRQARIWILSYLGKKCSECGNDNPIVLEIHRNDGHDEYPSVEYVMWFKQKTIPKDVELLCANCHKIHHHETPRVKRKWGWRNR